MTHRPAGRQSLRGVNVLSPDALPRLTRAGATLTMPWRGIACRGTAPTLLLASMVPEPAAQPLSVPVFQILLSLADEEMHGYAIIQDVAARTRGEVRLTASTLYAAVKRPLDAGWIEELAERPHVERDDARRRYYRLTALGREAARAEARRVERLAGMARAKRLLPPLRPAPERP